jgi:predicted peptidase
MEILDGIVSSYSVDPDQIYVAGVSSGGNACWEIAMRYPDRFAAVAPMATSGGDLRRVNRLTKLPIWAFHAREDELPPGEVEKLVAALQSSGANVRLTLVDNARHSPPGVLYHHDCWTGAIMHFDVINWLFAQRRGARLSLPPGISPWPWWNYGALASMAMIIIVAWKIERKRRLGLGEQHTSMNLSADL